MPTNKKRVQGYLSDLAYEYLEKYRKQQELNSISSALEMLLESLANENSNIDKSNNSYNYLKMDKVNYFKRSQELNVPLRCPFIQYCERYAFSIYYLSYDNEKLDKDRKETTEDFLLRRYELPSDYHERKIKLCGESISITQNGDESHVQNLCPELSLFTDHACLASPKEAISSYTYSKNEGFKVTEHKHFSECLEFIRATYFATSRLN